MDNCNHSSLEHAERQKPILAIVEPIVQNSNRIIGEEAFNSNEVETVTLDIRTTFCFVPLESHKNCSYKL